MANLAVNYRDAGRLNEATTLLEQTCKLARKQSGTPAVSLAWIPKALAATYDRAGQFAKSEPLYREALEKARKPDGEASPWPAGALHELGWNLLKQRKYAEAEPLLRECVEIIEVDQPDAWTTFNTGSLLGGSLLGQEKYAEAELRLLSGYEGMKLREKTIPIVDNVRLTEALERLVNLYDDSGRKEKADEWRKKLTAAKSAKPAEAKKD